ncbi:MAG: LysR family transcriptional regulator [Hyphomicrobiaceae bacterium]
MTIRNRSIRLDWEDLRVLVELARRGSLSATARTLGVTHVTVSRRIANLEADLDQPLFSRESGRYVLTEAGKRVLELASPMADQADAIIRAASVFQETISGPVRITSTEAVGVYFVLPALKVIRSRYPDLDLDLRISQQNLSLARSDAEIAVRLACPAPDSSLVGAKVADLSYHVYGARSYVDRRKPELFEYIGYAPEFANWPEAQALDPIARGGRTAVRINHLSNRIEAARLGLGLALLPSVMAEPWPELVRVSRGPAIMTREIWVLVHQDLKDVPRIKVCFDILVETIRQPHTTSLER